MSILEKVQPGYKIAVSTYCSVSSQSRKFNAGNPSSYIVRRKNRIVSLMGKLEKVDFDKKRDK
jgi:hypothetical protein